MQNRFREFISRCGSVNYTKAQGVELLYHGLFNRIMEMHIFEEDFLIFMLRFSKCSALQCIISIWVVAVIMGVCTRDSADYLLRVGLQVCRK